MDCQNLFVTKKRLFEGKWTQILEKSKCAVDWFVRGAYLPPVKHQYTLLYSGKKETLAGNLLSATRLCVQSKTKYVLLLLLLLPQLTAWRRSSFGETVEMHPILDMYYLSIRTVSINRYHLADDHLPLRCWWRKRGAFGLLCINSRPA